MNLLLWIYLLASFLIVLWIIYLMRSKLDELDWQYHTNDIWFNCAMVLLFWPLLLILSPTKTLNANQLFDFDIAFGDLRIRGAAKRVRELQQFTNSPPPCSSKISYCHSYLDVESDRKIRLLFNAEDIVNEYKGKNLPLFSYPEQRAFVSWIKNRDITNDRPTEVPSQINFTAIAESLLQSGYGQIKCSECQTCYSASELSSQVPTFHAGWNNIEYCCPAGHELVKFQHVHISV